MHGTDLTPALWPEAVGPDPAELARVARGRRPGQSAHPVPLREPDQYRFAETTMSGVRGTDHRLARAAAVVVDLRFRRRGRSDPRVAAAQPAPRFLRAVPVPAPGHHLCR